MQTSSNIQGTQDCCSKFGDNLPLAILALAVLLFFVFQVQQAFADRTMLQQIRDGQAQALAQGKEVQARLDQLAVATVRLADAGNANAKTLIERMKQAGITINPAKVAPPATDAAAPQTPGQPQPAGK
ncbi:MAG: hypothetical protein WBK91_00085 [Alphaproteobacteria bacterium]